MFEKLLPFIVLSLSWMQAVTQNLVRNPGFEHHLPKRCIGCDWIDGHREGLAFHWLDIGHSGGQLFTNNYRYTSEDIRKGFSPDTRTPFQGEAVYSMHYYGGGKGLQVGGGDYMMQQLPEPLRQNQHYAIRFWVKILPSAGLRKYQDFPLNFGISFSDKAFKKNYRSKVIINDTPFRLRKFRAGEWIPVEFIIRPTRDLSFLVIGSFLDLSRPYSFDYKEVAEFIYLLDEVSIEKISEPGADQLSSAIAYPYLRRRKKHHLPTARENLLEETVFFEFGSQALNREAISTLDKLIPILKANPEILLQIQGHTDSIGTQNELLSAERAAQVRNYLIRKGKLPAHRFDSEGFGSSNAIADNATDDGRQLNRRVEIRQSNVPLRQHLYRVATHFASAAESDSAFRYLALWQNLDGLNQALLLADPGFRTLHSSSKWKAVVHFAKSEFKIYPAPGLAFRLEQLYFKFGPADEIRPYYREVKGELTTEWRAQWHVSPDTSTLKWLSGILDRGTWPDRTQVGARAAIAPLFVLMRSRSKELMRKYEPLAQKAFEENLLHAEDYAAYMDFLQILETGFQKYGTQYRERTDHSSLLTRYPLKEPAEVNHYRASIGLPALKE